jgi:hypothetical protein
MQDLRFLWLASIDGDFLGCCGMEMEKLFILTMK